jgi:hypothetical protein
MEENCAVQGVTPGEKAGRKTKKTCDVLPKRNDCVTVIKMTVL